MSGDVQPRKRKEKRRKKEDSEEVASNFSSDEHFHVHKDASTGGNICAKILFFLLSFLLLVMIGLVLFEYRGFGDDEALVPVSKWAPTFDGWLDEAPAKHDEHDEVSDSEEHGPAESEEHSGETIEHQKKSAGMHEQSHEVDSEEDVDVKKRESRKVKEKPQHLEDSDTVSAKKRTKVHHGEKDKLAAQAGQPPVTQNAVTERPTSTKHKDAGKFADVESPESSSKQTTKGSASSITEGETHDGATTAPSVQQSKRQPVNSKLSEVGNTVTELNSKISSSGEGSKIESSPKSTHHSASDMKERDRPHISIKDSSVNQQDSKINKEGSKYEQHKELKKNSEKKSENSGAAAGEKKITKSMKEDKKYEQHKDLKKNSENAGSGSEETVATAPGVGKKVSESSKEDRKREQHKELEKSSESYGSGSESTGSTIPAGEKTVSTSSKEDRKYEQHKVLEKSAKSLGTGPQNSVATALGEEKKVSKISKGDRKHEKHKELNKSSESRASESGNSGAAAPGGEEKLSKHSKNNVQEIKKMDTSNSGKSTQFQQKSDANSQSKSIDMQISASSKGKRPVRDSQAPGNLGMKGDGNLPPKVKTQQPVDSVQPGNKPLMKQKDKEMKIIKMPDETKSNSQKQPDPHAKGQSPPASHEMASSKQSEPAKRLSEGKPETPTQKGGDEIKNVKTSQSKIVEEEEDEPEPSGVSKTRQPERDSEDSGSEKGVPATKSKIPKNMGGQNAQVYSKADITNQDDWNIIRELDAADDDDAEEKPEIAIHQYDTLLRSNPNSPRAWYGKATALDHLAAKKKSNFILDQAIDAYKKVASGLKNVPEKLFMLSAERCIDRMRFRGVHGKAVQIHKLLMERFPDKPDYQNQLAVTYLMINRITEAKNVLENVLQKWPKNGFAQAHYGFILKTGNYNMTEAVRYLQAGISSREPGTIDGRFFFQLGDALMRLGRRKEAMEVNELGVKEGLFLSKYQRSLYNVDRLRAQPWWSLEETTYGPNLRQLEENWIQIKNEGIKALYDTDKNLFRDEAENLRDSGKWKQLELFARGRKIPSNCAKAPVTCKLIEEFPAARDCRRGQVKFSVMDPGTHVWPHCGPTNCRLRAHLGLVVPKNTFIRVAEETRSWEEGKLFIFDDSFEHEVWHNGSATRLVLIIDVWHPDLTAEEKRSLPAI